MNPKIDLEGLKYERSLKTHGLRLQLVSRRENGSNAFVIICLSCHDHLMVMS